MRSFFYMLSKTESAGLPQLCAVKSARVTRPLPLWLVRGCDQSVSESQLCFFNMVKRDESLQLFPPSKKDEVCRMEFFPVT